MVVIPMVKPELNQTSKNVWLESQLRAATFESAGKFAVKTKSYWD
jgi:hypothetical protein